MSRLIVQRGRVARTFGYIHTSACAIRGRAGFCKHKANHTDIQVKATRKTKLLYSRAGFDVCFSLDYSKGRTAMKPKRWAWEIVYT